MLLRLLDCGFMLVADDRVDIDDGVARVPEALAGLIEVRGLGILRLPFVDTVPLALVVAMGRGERLPEAEQRLGLPLVRIAPAQAAAPARVVAALRCALGDVQQLAGAFA